MKKNKIFALSVILLLVMGVFVSCGKTDGDNPEKKPQNNGIKYSVGFAENYGQDKAPFRVEYLNAGIKSDLKAKVDSVKELKKISTENEYPFFNENDENYNSALSKKIRKYDEAFFKDHSLVLIFSFGTNYNTARLTDLSLSGDKLVATISKPVTEYETEQQRAFTYIIEVEKAGTKDVKNIEVKLVSNGKFHILSDYYSPGIVSMKEARDIICYYHNGKEYVDGKLVDTDYVPAPLSPQTLDFATEELIRYTLLDYFYYKGFSLGEQTGTQLMNAQCRYLGTYNGYVAVYFKLGGIACGVNTVGDYSYNSPGILPILLWEKANN